MGNQNKSLKARVGARLITVLFLLGLIFFGTAGTLAWPEAWIYIVTHFSFSAYISVWLLKHNPGLLKDRMTMMKKSAYSWDKVILIGTTPFFLALVMIPGFDAVRYQWSRVSVVIKILSFVGIFVSIAWFFRVLKENSHLTRIVEIQTQRNHRVVTTGPYKFVRHPMYFGVIVLFFCIPLALGSWYGVIPASFLAVGIFLRTYFEDKTLLRELSGYTEYAQQTRFRLIPGVW